MSVSKRSWREFLLFSIYFDASPPFLTNFRLFFLLVHSDVEEDDDPDEDEEDYGGPKEGDDGLGPIAGRISLMNRVMNWGDVCTPIQNKMKERNSKALGSSQCSGCTGTF